MEIIKKILIFIVEPFHKYGSRGISEKTTKVVKKNQFITYSVAFLITALIIGYIYFIK